MKNNVAIIGCGNLGRRHLQAAVQTKSALDIYVYDINTEVFKIAEDILKDTPCYEGTEVHYITSLEQLPHDIFITVVASSASGRAQLVKNIVAQSKVKYFILEKVLFQSYDDYDVIEKLLEENKITAFVNCPRRYYPLYKELKGLINNKKFKIKVSGTDWGLACNFIHYLDIISYLGGCDSISVDLSLLDDNVKESKRPGYKEISGTINGAIGNCTEYSITSYENDETDFTLYIETDDDRILINESENKCYVIGNSTNWQMKLIKFETLYQSNLTNKYIEDILSSGNCSLTSYKESALLHKAYIKPLTVYFRERGEKNNLCPIT